MNLQEIDLSAAPPAQNLAKFSLGTAHNPSGVEILADGLSLFEDGKRITPVMGEIHYSRYPHSEWRDALLRMKAGGINVIASYVFWIHHEEIKNTWDWTADRDLHAFVTLCGELGLRCIIRCGPWCHGEVRNGGFPEWLLDKHLHLRTDDPQYLEDVRKLYHQIADQLHGLLWKDGGPVIGIQIENEYHGSPQHLLTLKQIAVDAGIDVPIYTRTGWPELTAPMPFGHLLPLYGGYAEGFWDRDLTAMPGKYWKEFVFKLVRTDAAIANERFGSGEVHDPPDTQGYPYLTCEIGPGMMCSYHRRIKVFPADVVSMVIAKLGSGSNSPGYYMYHGGTNPAGHAPWLQEFQASRYVNYNDLPVKSYDFQTCLGEFGQVREQYHLLRPIHLFLHDFGERLAPMPAMLPTTQAHGKNDTDTLRWAVRSDGQSGFVFVNNYQRLLPMPARDAVQLKLKQKDGEFAFPSTTIAADSAFFWPFNFDLGDGIALRYATAQLVCQLRDGNTIYTVFVETGNEAKFAFTGQTRIVADVFANEDGAAVLHHPKAGTTPVATLTGAHAVTHQIVLLDATTARHCYKGICFGQERLVLSSNPVIFEGDALRVTTTDSAEVAILPAPNAVQGGERSGLFTKHKLPVTKLEPIAATIKPVRDAGPLREIPIGGHKVAMQPTDADFDQAAVWKITLPDRTDTSRKLLLRIHYTGDVARVYLGDTLLTDNFYNGTSFEIGLNRYGDEAIRSGITLKILPLRKDAPLYLLDKPDLKGQPALAAVDRVEVIESYDVQLPKNA